VPYLLEICRSFHPYPEEPVETADQVGWLKAYPLTLSLALFVSEEMRVRAITPSALVC
jgi:hypothetical protein